MTEQQVAEEAARAAAAVLHRFRSGPKQVEHKGRVDLVTELDVDQIAAPPDHPEAGQIGQ